MGTLFKGLLGTAASALGGIWGYVAVGVIAAGVAGSAGVWTTHKIETAKYEALELKDANAATQVAINQALAEEEVAQKQHTLDTQTAVDAVNEAQAQTKIVTRTVTIEKEVQHYVTVQADRVSCIPNSVIRVLNAQIGDGFTPAETSSLAVTPEQPDDACSSVVASQLTSELIERIIKPAQLNAEQLNALELSIVNELKNQ